MSGLPADAWIGIFAHPDDEWLAGWPIFQRRDVRLGVIFFVGDNRPNLHPTDDRWESHLSKVLNGLGIQFLGCLGCSPDFFRSPRSERLAWRAHLERLVTKARAGAFADAGLVTHNPVGEYGHPDHIEVHRAVIDVQDRPPLVSDLCYEGTLSTGVRRLFYAGMSHGPFSLDRQRWVEARTAYRMSLRWTAWEWPGRETARLYEL